MSRRVLVPIADGTEEIEAVCLDDILRRSGASVTVASVDTLEATASRGVRLVADRPIADCVEETYDLIALPGGMPGAEHLRDSGDLEALLKRQQREGGLYAAICAAPVVVLQYHGLLAGRQATCHPGFVDRLQNADAVDKRVVVDGPCVTSRAPGTSVEFALKLVGLLYDDQIEREIARTILAAR